MPVEQAVIERLATERACFFLPTGELLWRSPAWLAESSDRVQADHQVSQCRWQEFIAAPDLPAVLHFLADGREGMIEFCSMIPTTGRPARIVWWKTPWRGQVLVLGEVIACECAVKCESINDCISARLPAAPCFAAW